MRLACSFALIAGAGVVAGFGVVAGLQAAIWLIGVL